MGEEPEAEESVSVRARYERFPATVKGAFVLRGDDRDPHQVAFKAGRVVPMAGRGGVEIAIRPEVLDVPPHQDVFLPFEFSISELEPGWYDLECDVDIDGSPETRSGGRRFSVAWPRGSVRRGTVGLPSPVQLEGLSVRFEPLECSGDHVELRYTSEPPERVGVRLVANGSALAEVEAEFDEAAGEGRIVAYPLMRTHSRVRIEVSKGRDSQASAEIELH